MAEPIEVKVIRAQDQIVITAWWDREGEWFNVRQVKDAHGDNTTPTVKYIRLSKKEAAAVVEAIGEFK